MSKADKLEKVQQAIEAAEASLLIAKQELLELHGGVIKSRGVGDIVGDTKVLESGKIIEGVFDGENMIGPDHKIYSVPANYASKSKLVAGDRLKLTISDEGKFLYKQIGPVERINKIGTLAYDGEHFKVVVNKKAYKVLYASVTYFKGKAGDRVTAILPEGIDTDWAAIENVLPGAISDVSEEPELSNTIDV